MMWCNVYIHVDCKRDTYGPYGYEYIYIYTYIFFVRKFPTDVFDSGFSLIHPEIETARNLSYSSCDTTKLEEAIAAVAANAFAEKDVPSAELISC